MRALLWTLNSRLPVPVACDGRTWCECEVGGRAGLLQPLGCDPTMHLQGGISSFPADQSLCSCSRALFGGSWSFSEDVASPWHLDKCQMWPRQIQDFFPVENVMNFEKVATWRWRDIPGKFLTVSAWNLHSITARGRWQTSFSLIPEQKTKWPASISYLYFIGFFF